VVDLDPSLPLLNSDAFDVMEYRNMTATMPLVVRCPGEQLFDNFRIGNVIVYYEGILPSICPFKYDVNTLRMYHSRTSRHDVVSCKDSLELLMAQDAMWRVLGAPLVVTMHVCASLNVSTEYDWTQCNPSQPHYRRLETALTLDPEIPCLAAEHGEACMGNFTNRECVMLTLANIDTPSDNIPAYLRPKSSSNKFLTEPTARRHVPNLGVTLALPVQFLFSPSVLSAYGQAFDGFLASRKIESKPTDMSRCHVMATSVRQFDAISIHDVGQFIELKDKAQRKPKKIKKREKRKFRKGDNNFPPLSGKEKEKILRWAKSHPDAPKVSGHTVVDVERETIKPTPPKVVGVERETVKPTPPKVLKREPRDPSTDLFSQLMQEANDDPELPWHPARPSAGKTRLPPADLNGLPDFNYNMDIDNPSRDEPIQVPPCPERVDAGCDNRS
jgi:hypothetical protein